MRLQNRSAPELWNVGVYESKETAITLKIPTSNILDLDRDHDAKLNPIYLKKVIFKEIHRSFCAKHFIQNGHQSTTTWTQIAVVDDIIFRWGALEILLQWEKTTLSGVKVDLWMHSSGKDDHLMKQILGSTTTGSVQK